MPTASARAANPAPLAEIARHCIIPDDIALTRYYELVAPELPGMGVTLDQWQQDIWEIGLGLRADGSLCCDVMGVTLSIARQAGKTWGVMVGLVAICLARPGTTVVWSSHHDRTSSETLTKIAGIVERPAIRPKMRPQFPVVYTDDSRGVHFANGSRILFGARSSGFGRGFSEVDIQVYDECQNLREAALTDMLAAMNVSDIGLAFFMGTPPRPQETRLGVDEAFKRRRTRAIEPKKGRPYKGVFVEFSADPDAPLEIDSDGFWEHLATANPSYGYRVGDSAIERLVENMSPEDVYREVMGIWDATVTRGVLPFDAWQDRRDEHSIPVDSFALGIEVGPDMAHASVCLAGQRADGDWHVELDEQRSGAAWTVAYVKQLVDANPQIRAVVVDVGGPIAGLLDEFKSAKVRLTPIKVRDLGGACSRMLDGTVTGWLRNTGQPQMDAAVKVAGKRALGDTGMWVFSRKSAASDITPVQAGALALWGAQNSDVTTPVAKRRKVVVLS